MSHRWLSYRDRQSEYHKLVRLVTRAFHSVEEIVVMDALLHLVEKLDTEPALHRVTEKDIQKLLRLPEKRILAILTKLRVSHLLVMAQTEVSREAAKAEAEARANQGPTFINYRRRIPLPQSRGTKSPSYTCYVDYDHVCKVVKWRRYSVHQSLNKKVDKSEVSYACPTPNCPMHGKPIPLIDLVMHQQLANKNERFGCEQCEALDPVTNRMIPTPLVPVGDFSGSNDAGSQERLKSLFNQQIAPLSHQLRLVEALLEEEISNPDEIADTASRQAKFESLEAAIQQQTDAANAAAITVEFGSKSGNAAQAGTGNRPASGAPASGSARVLHVPTIAANQAKGMVAALPWEQSSHTPLEVPCTSESAAEQREREVADEAARVEQDRKYQADFDRELERMTARAQQEALTQMADVAEETEVDSDMANAEVDGDAYADGEGDVLIAVQGKQMPLSEITQHELSLMTEEERELYEIYASEQF